MPSSQDSLDEIIELIDRLHRAGYRVRCERKPYSLGFKIMVERSGWAPTPNRQSQIWSLLPDLNIPIIYHAANSDGILKELARAANLLAPEAH